MLEKLQQRKHRLDKKIKTIKAWRRVSSIIFATAPARCSSDAAEDAAEAANPAPRRAQHQHQREEELAQEQAVPRQPVPAAGAEHDDAPVRLSIGRDVVVAELRVQARDGRRGGVRQGGVGRGGDSAGNPVAEEHLRPPQVVEDLDGPPRRPPRPVLRWPPHPRAAGRARRTAAPAEQRRKRKRWGGAHVLGGIEGLQIWGLWTNI
ncbi:unnamed protein product [Urochloa humidicola]